MSSISVQHLTKRYGTITAVDDVSFEVGSGEIVGLLGPNGAGKSTTMRVLSCFMPATSGSVVVNGFDVVRRSLAVRRSIGYLPENVPLPAEMRVIEYLDYRAKLKGVPRRERRARVGEVMLRCGVRNVERRIIGQLSKGYRQRVGLADALVHDPPILILDEPTVGLDPAQIREVRAFIKELGERHTILLSTHILPEVDLICGRVIIIANGRIGAEDSLENLRRGRRIVLEVRGEPRSVEAALARVRGITNVRFDADAGAGFGRFDLELRDGADAREDVARAVTSGGFPLRELRLETQSLEDVFIRTVSAEEPSARPVRPEPVPPHDGGDAVAGAAAAARGADAR